MHVIIIWADWVILWLCKHQNIFFLFSRCLFYRLLLLPCLVLLIHLLLSFHNYLLFESLRLSDTLNLIRSQSQRFLILVALHGLEFRFFFLFWIRRFLFATTGFWFTNLEFLCLLFLDIFSGHLWNWQIHLFKHFCSEWFLIDIHLYV